MTLKLNFQQQRKADYKPKSMHLHNALSTSDAIVLTKDDLGSGEGEDHYCREHLHSNWTDRGGTVNFYMEQVTTYVLKDPTCVSVED